MDCRGRIGGLARRLRRRLGEELGAVATEYGLLLLLIALVLVASAAAFGLAVSGLFQTGADAVP